MTRLLIFTFLSALFSIGPLRADPQSNIPPPQLTITDLPERTSAKVSAPAPPPGKVERGFAVKNAGSLFLIFPQGWKDSIIRVNEKDRLFDAVKFLPVRGNEFEALVEIINAGEANVRNMKLKSILETAGQAELTNAVEKSLEIVQLKGTNTTGFYFTITDKNRTIAAPQPGQYLFLTQGYASMGGIVLNFRLVSNHLTPEQDNLLEMIKTARLEKKSP